jgi:predicted metal-dependent hydrolase
MTSTFPSAGRAHTIEPRDLSLDIPAETPRYWLNGDPYQTHLMNAFSLVFPGGERFFMDAVRHFRDRIDDPTLLAQVRGFLGQEALHGREHRNMNRWLGSLGIPFTQFEQAIEDDIKRRRALRTPIDDLAVTCALEHFTALMAESWLNAPELREQCVEPLRSLWTWHALEELDHKAVAYDVYREVGGDYERRIRWMMRITVGFILGISVMHLTLLKREGKLEPRTLLKGWWKYWGPRGYFLRLLPSYLRYYKRDFHPWDEDHRPLIARFSRELGFVPRTAA